MYTANNVSVAFQLFAAVHVDNKKGKSLKGTNNADCVHKNTCDLLHYQLPTSYTLYFATLPGTPYLSM